MESEKVEERRSSLEARGSSPLARPNVKTEEARGALPIRDPPARTLNTLNYTVMLSGTRYGSPEHYAPKHRILSNIFFLTIRYLHMEFITEKSFCVLLGVIGVASLTIY